MPEAPKFYWLMSTILGSLRVDVVGQQKEAMSFLNANSKLVAD